MNFLDYTYMHSLVGGEDFPLDNIEDAIIEQRKRHLLLAEAH